MDYKDIRDEFVKKSGRYDLVNSDWTDNGADFFLNAGQRMLDRRADLEKLEARFYSAITAGSVYVNTTGLLAIFQAWIADSNGRARLERCSLSDIREFYYEPTADLTPGTPAYYAPSIVRPYPDTITATALAAFFDTDGVIASSTEAARHYGYSGIFFMPPSDGSYTLEIFGKFGSPVLSATRNGSVWTQTASVWTVQHPDILILAALYRMEVFYRNTEGAKDWLAAMDLDLVDLDKLKVDQECAEVTQMEG